MLQPAFFRQLGGSYEVADDAVCPLQDHDAPDASCTCGFYAVEDDEELWRLGGYEPELAVLDVDLAGRVIEHEHGFHASHQRVRRVTHRQRVRALRSAGRRRCDATGSVASRPRARRHAGSR